MGSRSFQERKYRRGVGAARSPPGPPQSAQGALEGRGGPFRPWFWEVTASPRRWWAAGPSQDSAQLRFTSLDANTLNLAS